MVKEYTLYTGQIVKEYEGSLFKLYEEEGDKVGQEIDVLELVKSLDNIIKDVIEESI